MKKERRRDFIMNNASLPSNLYYLCLGKNLRLFLWNFLSPTALVTEKKETDAAELARGKKGVSVPHHRNVRRVGRAALRQPEVSVKC